MSTQSDDPFFQRLRSLGEHTPPPPSDLEFRARRAIVRHRRRRRTMVAATTVALTAGALIVAVRAFDGSQENKVITTDTTPTTSTTGPTATTRSVATTVVEPSTTSVSPTSVDAAAPNSATVPLLQATGAHDPAIASTWTTGSAAAAGGTEDPRDYVRWWGADNYRLYLWGEGGLTIALTCRGVHADSYEFDSTTGHFSAVGRRWGVGGDWPLNEPALIDGQIDGEYATVRIGDGPIHTLKRGWTKSAPTCA